MKESDIPGVVAKRWAQDAGSGYINVIPTSPGTIDGEASLSLGFPADTFLPDAAGGVPPFGADFNGALNQVYGWAQWMEAGVLAKYSGTFSTAVGGYPKGALLQSTTLGQLWLSKVDDNTADPDVTPTNWLPIGNGRLISVQVFQTAGSFTYTAPSGARRTRVRACAGGGAGGGTQATSAGQVAVGGGGGAGSSGEIWVEDPCNGFTVVVGAAGVAASGMAGGNGGSSSFGGTYLACPGGSGGSLGLAIAPAFTNGGGLGGTAASASGSSTTAVQLSGGMSGGVGVAFTIVNAASGQGGSCGDFGAGGVPSADGDGSAAVGAGGGGSGACSLPGESARPGGNGSIGRVIVEAYS